MRHVLLLVVALAGCSLSVDYTGTYYECGAGGACPEGYVCKSQVCIPTTPEPPAFTRRARSGSDSQASTSVQAAV